MANARRKAAAGRPRDPAVDAAIRDAALALFAARGLADTSIEQIARRAGVTRATVYRRWRSKEALLADAFGDARQTAEAPLGDWQRLPFEQVLAWFIRIAPKAMAEPRNLKFLQRAIGATPDFPALRDLYWTGTMKPRRDGFIHLLAQAQAHGRIRPEADLDLVQDMLSGALLLHVLFTPGRRTETAIRSYLLRLLAALGLNATGRTRK